MCDFCIPILGRGGLPHTNKDCALKQTAHCSNCGSGVHFRTQCPKMQKSIHPLVKPIAASPTAKQPAHMEMSNSVIGYMEYLRQNGVEVPKKITEIRSAVQKHLLSQDTPLLLVNPPPMNPVCPVETTVCKKAHGDNMHCAKALEQPAEKKKNRLHVVKT
jgi:hypothetical protein